MPGTLHRKGKVIERMLGPLALILLPHPALTLRAEALPSADRLQVRLSVKNVSSRPQTLWMATPACSNSRWKVLPPEVRILDYAQSTTKICMVACDHRRILKPGETFVRTVEPDMPLWRKVPIQGRAIDYGLRPGPLTLTFRLFQPNAATVNDTSLPDAIRYKQLFLTSNPIQVDVKPRWLHA